MFYDLPEQVFILVYDVWMRFRENRQKSQSVLILVRAFLYEFNEQPEKAGILFAAYPIKTPISLNMPLELKTTMKTCSLTPICPAIVVFIFSLDQNFFRKNSFFAQKTRFFHVFKALQKL